LPTAQRRLESSFQDDIIVERWSLRSFIAVTRSCKLYDYEAREWRTFRFATATCQPLLRVLQETDAP
jgi:hypothetical protein